jgi:hypothetical protein
MGKPVALEDRAVYRVQGYLNKKENADFEKFCAKKKKGVSAMVVVAIRELLYNQTRTSDKL